MIISRAVRVAAISAMAMVVAGAGPARTGGEGRVPAPVPAPPAAGQAMPPQPQAPPLPPLPVRAPDAAQAGETPEQWSASEIGDARRICEEIAQRVSARFELLPQRRDGACGAPAPVRLESIGAQDAVRFVPPPVVTCDLVAGLAEWIERGLKPLAEKHLDGAVSEVRVMSSYSCRTRYGRKGARMSEHAYANALDIGGFRLADGREVEVLSGWGATRRELMAAAAAVENKAAAIVPPAAAPSAAGPGGGAGPEGAARAETETAAALPPVPVRRPLRQGGGWTAVATSRQPAPPRGAARTPPPRSPPPKSPPTSQTASQVTSVASGARKAAAPERRPSSGAPAPRGGPDREAARFLRESHKAACAIFGTTLGPEANEAHQNHFHVDMFPRRNRGYCE